MWVWKRFFFPRPYVVSVYCHVFETKPRQRCARVSGGGGQHWIWEQQTCQHVVVPAELGIQSSVSYLKFMCTTTHAWGRPGLTCMFSVMLPPLLREACWDTGERVWCVVDNTAYSCYHGNCCVFSECLVIEPGWALCWSALMKASKSFAITF